MSYENKDEDQKFALIVLGGIITAVVVGVLALCTLVGVGGGDSANAQKADASAMVAPAVLTTTAGAVSVAADDEAKVVVENGVVKFYFASGSADLAPGAADALGDVVKGVAAGQTAVISGYHDTTGDPAQNEELAKQRALAVRDALKALGIGDDKLDLKKPEVTTATGSNAEARRVEVSLQ